MLLTHFSLISLSSLLLLGAAFVEVFRSTTNRPIRIRMLFYLASASLFIIALILDHSLYTLGSRPFFIAQYPAAVLMTISFAEMCRIIAGIDNRQFMRLYWGTFLIAAVVWTYCFYVAVSQGEAFQSPAYSMLLFLPIGALCAALFMLAYSLYQRTSIFPVFLFACWRALDKHDDAGKAIFGYFITSIAYVFGSFAPVLARINDSGTEFVYGGFYINILVILACLIVTYFLFVERRVNLAQKLTSILVVMLMTTFVAVVVAFYNEEEDMTVEDAAFFI